MARTSFIGLLSTLVGMMMSVHESLMKLSQKTNVESLFNPFWRREMAVMLRLMRFLLFMFSILTIKRPAFVTTCNLDFDLSSHNVGVNLLMDESFVYSSI